MEEKRAGTLALIFSFLFPLVGIIYYFVNRKKLVNASSCLYAALGGFVLGVVLRLAASV